MDMEYSRICAGGTYRKWHLMSIRKASLLLDLICSRSSIILFISILLVSEVSAKLTLTKECGELVCKPHYYCSQFDHACRPCQEACDKALSNYDEDLCEKDCQDYLHDLFYMRKSLVNHSEYEDEKVRLFYDDIQEELFTLKILLMVTIIISTMVMIFLFMLVLYLKRSRNRLGISNPGWCGGKGDEIMELPVIYSNSKCFTLPRNTTESAPNLTNNNNMNVSRVSTPDLVSRSEGAIPVSIMSVNKSPFPESAIKPQRFRREPSESTLPEYLGYDNPALTHSPTHI